MRSGCVNIHLKGNTQGRIWEGFGRFLLCILTVVSCLIWRKERRMDEWEIWMEIRKRAELMLKYMGLDEDERWEGMVAKIYGWKQRKGAKRRDEDERKWGWRWVAENEGRKGRWEHEMEEGVSLQKEGWEKDQKQMDWYKDETVRMEEKGGEQKSCSMLLWRQKWLNPAL